MTNKHASKQHGAAMVNDQRPKSKLRKRVNKHRSVAKKAAIIEERRTAAKAPAVKES